MMLGNGLSLWYDFKPEPDRITGDNLKIRRPTDQRVRIMKRSKFTFLSIAAACIAWNHNNPGRMLCAQMSPSVGWTVSVWREVDPGDWECVDHFHPSQVDQLFDFIYGRTEK